MTFQPHPSRAGWLALGATLVLSAAAIYMLGILSRQTTPPHIFQALAAALVAGSLALMTMYWAAVGLNLRYHLDRNGIVIQWGVARQYIPFNNILEIVPGNAITATPTFKGINLAGLRFGRGELPGYSRLRYRTTAPLEQSLLVVTARISYVISPQQPEQFIRAWQSRQQLGPTQDWIEGLSRRWPFDTPLVTDLLALWLLALGAMLLLALFGFISLSYAALPAALPIHFDSLGRADRIAPRIFLFTLPAAGAIVWSLNLLLGGFIYRREPVGAYLLWGSTLIMLLCLWLALFTIIGA